MRNNAGRYYYNELIFWKMMSPQGRNLKADYGSYRFSLEFMMLFGLKSRVYRNRAKNLVYGSRLGALG